MVILYIILLLLRCLGLLCNEDYFDIESLFPSLERSFVNMYRSQTIPNNPPGKLHNQLQKMNKAKYQPNNQPKTDTDYQLYKADNANPFQPHSKALTNSHDQLEEEKSIIAHPYNDYLTNEQRINYANNSQSHNKLRNRIIANKSTAHVYNKLGDTIIANSSYYYDNPHIDTYNELEETNDASDVDSQHKSEPDSMKQFSSDEQYFESEPDIQSPSQQDFTNFQSSKYNEEAKIRIQTTEEMEVTKPQPHLIQFEKFRFHLDPIIKVPPDYQPYNKLQPSYETVKSTEQNSKNKPYINSQKEFNEHETPVLGLPNRCNNSYPGYLSQKNFQERQNSQNGIPTSLHIKSTTYKIPRSTESQEEQINTQADSLEPTDAEKIVIDSKCHYQPVEQHVLGQSQPKSNVEGETYPKQNISNGKSQRKSVQRTSKNNSLSIDQPQSTSNSESQGQSDKKDQRPKEQDEETSQEVPQINTKNKKNHRKKQRNKQKKVRINQKNRLCNHQNTHQEKPDQGIPTHSSLDTYHSYSIFDEPVVEMKNVQTEPEVSVTSPKDIDKSKNKEIKCFSEVQTQDKKSKGLPSGVVRTRDNSQFIENEELADEERNFESQLKARNSANYKVLFQATSEPASKTFESAGTTEDASSLSVENDINGKVKTEFGKYPTNNIKLQSHINKQIEDKSYGNLFNTIGFSYDEEDPLGPYNWSSIFKSCAGNNQSPINIDTSCLKNINVGPLQWSSGYFNMPKSITLESTGHQLILRACFPNSYKPKLSGGSLRKSYTFRSITFHWGMFDIKGSEHTIDEIAYPMEMHVIHSCGPEHEARNLVIVAYFFQIARDEPEALDNIIEVFLKAVKNPSKAIPLKHLFNLASLIQPFFTEYVTYYGSLTVPPCTQGVKWIVYPYPLDISKEQLNKFRDICKYAPKLRNNFRPVQPLNNRKVCFAM